METKSIADDFNTFKSQSNFTRKEIIFVDSIFSESFIEFLEKTMEELWAENNPKNAEIYKNLLRELGESIQELKSENIDVRIQTLVFTKSLVDIVMESTSLHLKSNERV